MIVEDTSNMTVADVTRAVFGFFNGFRFLACVPQIAKAIKDQSGAEAISFGTWGLFLASHVSAMAYAVVNQGDWAMAFLFLGNALGCGMIILIATCSVPAIAGAGPRKRFSARRQSAQHHCTTSRCFRNLRDGK
jgi:hypothetical protein